MIQPKNPHNQTYSKLPVEVTKAISEAFEEVFERKHFLCKARVYLNEMVLRVGFTEDQSIKQVNFDVSYEFDSEKDKKPLKALEKLLDIEKELYFSYFEDEDEKKFSPIWAQVENTEIHYRFDGTNTELEAEANRLLGEDSEELGEDQMVVGDFEELDEIEKIVETLKTKTPQQNF